VRSVIVRVAPAPVCQFRAERDLAPIESLIRQPLAADFTRVVVGALTVPAVWWRRRVARPVTR